MKIHLQENVNSTSTYSKYLRTGFKSLNLIIALKKLTERKFFNNEKLTLPISVMTLFNN